MPKLPLNCNLSRRGSRSRGRRNADDKRSEPDEKCPRHGSSQRGLLGEDDEQSGQQPPVQT